MICCGAQVLARGERIENLVDKTDNLRTQADRFHRWAALLRVSCVILFAEQSQSAHILPGEEILRGTAGAKDP